MRVVSVWRSPLDKLLCDVHDCFAESAAAHMVTYNGSWWRCEDYPWKRGESGSQRWARRRGQVRKNKRKIMLDPAATERAMRWGMSLGDRQAAFLSETLGFANASFTTLRVEDLEAFEYDAERLEDSVSAWMQWMGSWGVDARRDTVRRVLSEGAHVTRAKRSRWIGGNVGRRKHKPLSDYVYNAQAVTATLLASQDDRVRGLVRRDDDA